MNIEQVAGVLEHSLELLKAIEVSRQGNHIVIENWKIWCDDDMVWRAHWNDDSAKLPESLKLASRNCFQLLLEVYENIAHDSLIFGSANYEVADM